MSQNTSIVRRRQRTGPRLATASVNHGRTPPWTSDSRGLDRVFLFIWTEKVESLSVHIKGHEFALQPGENRHSHHNFYYQLTAEHQQHHSYQQLHTHKIINTNHHHHVSFHWFHPWVFGSHFTHRDYSRLLPFSHPRRVWSPAYSVPPQHSMRVHRLQRLQERDF